MTMAEQYADHLGLAPVACLLGGLSDPTRLQIVRRLAAGEQRVVDLTTAVGLAQSTVSQHLACLRDCGVVSSRPVGRASVFALTHPEPTRRLLEAAEALVQATR